MTPDTNLTIRAFRPGPLNSDIRNTAFHAVILKAFPNCTEILSGETVINVKLFARFIGKSRMSIYRWCEGGKMSPKTGYLIVDKSEGRLKIEDLHPFIL